MSRAIETHGLTAEQAELVDNIIEAGTLEKACEAMDFDSKAAKRLFRDHPGFQAAVGEALRLAQMHDAIKAQAALRFLLHKRGLDDSIRLRAVDKALDRGLGKAAEQVFHQHEHRHTLDRDGLVERIMLLSEQLGLEPKKLDVVSEQ